MRRSDFDKKPVWIVAHRGHFGGNIAENTLNAFELALSMGADVLETDTHKTKDGQLVLFHDPSPDRTLHLPGPVEDYTLKELRHEPIINAIGERSSSRVNTLDEMLERFSGRCMIDLDQCWMHADEVYERVCRYHMQELAIIKGGKPYDGILDWLKRNDYAPEFKPVLFTQADLDAFFALPDRVRMSMVEIVVFDENDDLISEEVLSEFKRRGLRVWINTLTLAGFYTMSAKKDDDLSILGDPDGGWGYWIDKGVGVIQTDWPHELNRYLIKRGLR